MPVKNICDCHKPPGGRVVCEPHQMAICSVINGVARRECLNPPLSGSPEELANWALSEVTGLIRLPNAPINNIDLGTLMDRTRTSIRFDGAVITFALPEKIIRAVRTLVNESKDREIGHAEAE